MKTNKYLIIFLILSFLIRIYKINSLSLFGDEIDVGYQAYSLFQNGHDYKGNFLPIYIESLSESRAPLLIYSTIPSIALFGLNEIGVRLPSVIFGVLSLYLIFKLVFLLSKDKTLALYSTIVLSLSPWHYHYSRTAFEVTLLLSLILFGVYFSYKFLLQQKNKFIYLAIFFFSLSFYTYNTANIFTPLIIFFIFLTNLKFFTSKINYKIIFISLLLFLILSLPLIHQIFLGTAANRFKLISIFNNQQIIDQIVTKRTIFSASSPQIEALFHNKPIAWINEFTKNYISSLSLPFLFISGDQSNLRHTIPGYGLFFIAYLPFLVYGLFRLSYKDKLNKLMFFWLLFSPIASSLTIDGSNHATRIFLMTIPIAYFSALGLKQFFNNKGLINQIFLFLISLFLIFQIIGYSHEYFIHYPKDSFESWNFGYQDLFKSIPKTNKNIFISNAKYNSLLPFSFYQRYKIKNEYLNDKEQINILSNLSGFKINHNIYFINDFKQIDHLSVAKQITKPGDIILLFQNYDIPGDMDFSLKPFDEFKTIKTVYNPNNTILGQVIQRL